MTDDLNPAPFDAATWLKTQPHPFETDKVAAVQAILTSKPDILLFRHYWWLTGIPVPPRRNLVSDEDYMSRNWWRLLRAAKEWKVA